MKKVLTVFLSIALVLAMMPAMVFATNGNAEDTKLYCFYHQGETVSVGENGYLTGGEESELQPVTNPEIVIGREMSLYFATKDDNGYKAVSQITCRDENVQLKKQANGTIELSISKTGTYELSYVNDNNTHKLTVTCVLPRVGCYSSDTAAENTYLDSIFRYSENNDSFYIVVNEELGNITGARYVNEHIEDENAQMTDVQGVAIAEVAGKDNIRKVTVDADVFTDEKQDLSGDMVVDYGEGSCSVFSFFIYGPNYNSDDEDSASDIEFYSDEECSSRIHDFSVNTSLKPSENCFYIKSAKGQPSISEITTYYTENDAEGNTIYYAGVFECNTESAIEKYYKYTDDKQGDITLETTEFKPNVTINEKPNAFVKTEAVNKNDNVYKLSFTAAGNKVYRGHENMRFKIVAGTVEEAVSENINIDYGVNLQYEKAAFAKVIPTHENFGYFLGDAESAPWISEVNGKPYWNGLGGASSSDSDRCGSELWIAVDTADGYRITDIKNAADDSSLPYTIQAEYYYRVYNGNTEIIVSDDCEYGGSISSNNKKAFYAWQNVGCNNNPKTSFNVRDECVTEFKEFCKNNNYTASLIGYALSYTVFIPVDKQCEVKIETEKVSGTNKISTVQVNNSFGAKSVTATSAMQTNLDNYYKQGKEITGVYELTAEALNGTVDVVIPVEGNPSDYEIVWFKDEDTPVPTVTRYLDGAVMFTTGHFSTYAIVKNKSNTPAGGGGVTGGGAVMPPAADEDDVKTTKDSTTSETKTSTTVKDTKTETVKNEQGEEISKVTATVSEKLANNLVEQAVSNKSDTVEITVKSNDGNKAAQTEVEIPKKALESIAKDTDADLVITTDNGQVTLDNKTLETIAAEAEGDTVKITVNENTQLKEEQKPASDVIGKNGKLFDIKAVIGDRIIHDFKGGKAHVILPMPEKLKGKDIVIIYINDKGICEILNHTMETVGAEEYIKFTTSHFSNFAVVEKADAEKIIDKQNADKINSLIREAKLKATTSKTLKKNVRIKVSVRNNNSLIKEAKAMGYTVKYKFYRSTKKASKYKAVKTKTSNTYISTNGKKGTKYYYKAKVLVYDGKKLVTQTTLKQCSYGARTWSK